MLGQVERGDWQPTTITAVTEPEPVPTFHVFASEWFARVREELAAKTVEQYAWQLTNHLLPYFASKRLDAITAEDVDRYRARKAAEKTLHPRTINQTLMRLAQILEDAVEYGHIARNPARGKNRRIKGAGKPHRPYLDRADQITALLDAAGSLDRKDGRRSDPWRRPMLATLVFGGLRIGEAIDLRWRDVDLAAGRLRVRESKTDAGVRYVDLLLVLRDELLAWKGSQAVNLDALAFPP